jgi:AcrR family transcriptional regulator
MHSNKSTGKKNLTALEPQRRHGKKRVASVLEAGAAVIAEKGYDGATMSEIAERSGSPIGSLYRFFPNKEVLANALVERYARQIDEEFDKIDSRVETLSSDDIADAIIDFMNDSQNEKKAILALIEARSEWSAKCLELRSSALKHIGKTLTLLSPSLTPQMAEDMAVIMLHNMRTMRELKFGYQVLNKYMVPISPGAVEELRRMNRLYLASKLASPALRSSVVRGK